MPICKICTASTEEIIPFGNMPIANGFVTDPATDEYLYPMTVDFCPTCYMVQLRETVKPEMMFNEHYHFFSSTSSSMADHFKEVAEDIIQKTATAHDPFVIELGCNDGIMLHHIAEKKMRHLGIEPSANVADVAREKGITVTEDFFNADTAQKIREKYGQADVIFGANVMCHIEDINSVFEAIIGLYGDMHAWRIFADFRWGNVRNIFNEVRTDACIIKKRCTFGCSPISAKTITVIFDFLKGLLERLAHRIDPLLKGLVPITAMESMVLLFSNACFNCR